MMAPAMVRAFPGSTRKAPSATSSGMQETSLATTGVPQAMASSTGKPKPS